jgi:hypothetical protein
MSDLSAVKHPHTLTSAKSTRCKQLGDLAQNTATAGVHNLQGSGHQQSYNCGLPSSAAGCTKLLYQPLVHHWNFNKSCYCQLNTCTVSWCQWHGQHWHHAMHDDGPQQLSCTILVVPIRRRLRRLPGTVTHDRYPAALCFVMHETTIALAAIYAGPLRTGIKHQQTTQTLFNLTTCQSSNMQLRLQLPATHPICNAKNQPACTPPSPARWQILDKSTTRKVKPAMPGGFHPPKKCKQPASGNCC